MKSNKKVGANNNNSSPKANGEAKTIVNYTPYRKNYNKAKAILVQNNKEEFRAVLAELIVTQA